MPSDSGKQASSSLAIGSLRVTLPSHPLIAERIIFTGYVSMVKHKSSHGGKIMRRKDILEETHWSLGTVLMNYHVCQHCHTVYVDPSQALIGMACQRCGRENTDGWHDYFDISVWSLINLIQEFYHKDGKAQQSPTGTQLGTNSPLAVVIFFATLREVLLKHFLTEIMIAQRLTVGVSKRLFDDNQSQSQMLNHLFPALSGGVKWNQALNRVQPQLTFDPFDLNKFLIAIADARNSCLHAGSHWAIEKQLAEQCMLRISEVLELYVALHNEFVPAQYHKTSTNNATAPSTEHLSGAEPSVPQG
jgi:hypothetical protein